MKHIKETEASCIKLMNSLIIERKPYHRLEPIDSARNTTVAACIEMTKLAFKKKPSYSKIQLFIIWLFNL